MVDSGSRLERETLRALRFTQCSRCAYDFATGRGSRACHYYVCPYLPEQMDVVCPTCNFNFLARDGDPGCGDPPACAFAVDEAPARVDALQRWLQLQKA